MRTAVPVCPDQLQVKTKRRIAGQVYAVSIEDDTVPSVLTRAIVHA